MVRSLLRILRLLGVYAKMDLLWLARDSGQFVTWAVTDGILNAATVGGMLLLAERFGGIGPWSRDQLVFMLGYGALTSGTMHVLFGYNVAFISRRLGRGQLDHTLLQPAPVWMTLATEGFVPFSGAAMLAPGMLLLLWGTRAVPHPGALWFLALTANLAASTAVAMSFQVMWGCAAFWHPRAAEEINSETSELLETLRPFPLDGLRPLLRGALGSALPVGLLAWYPARALIGLSRAPLAIAATPAAAVVYCCAAGALFALGRRHYARIGAQGYSAFGHRR